MRFQMKQRSCKRCFSRRGLSRAKAPPTKRNEKGDGNENALLFSRIRFNSKKGVKKKVQNDSIFGVKFTPVLLTPSEE